MFSADYFTARERFRRAAGMVSRALGLSATGPNDESLSIDIAWIGDPAAQRLLLVTSGIHGVEGFAGSALQCAFMAKKIEPPPKLCSGRCPCPQPVGIRAPAPRQRA